MRIKKSDLQKIINEAVLKEMAASGAVPKIIVLAKKARNWQAAYEEGTKDIEEIAKMAAAAYVRDEAFRMKQEIMHWGNIEYIAKELKKHWG